MKQKNVEKRRVTKDKKVTLKQHGRTIDVTENASKEQQKHEKPKWRGKKSSTLVKRGSVLAFRNDACVQTSMNPAKTAA